MGKEETEVVYGVTSLSKGAASAKDLHDLVRAYWGIENGLRQRREVTMREDRTRQTLGHAGQVVASLNNLVSGLLRHAGFTNLARARRLYASLFNPATYHTLAHLINMRMPWTRSAPLLAPSLSIAIMVAERNPKSTQ